MNFVGKMLVIVILMFSCVCMSMTVVVFQTVENHKVALDKVKLDLQKATGETQASKQQVAQVEEEKKKAVQELAQAKTEFAGKLDAVTKERDALEIQKKDLETQRQVMQQSLESAQSESTVRVDESGQLREKLTKTQTDANKLQIDKTSLNAEISDLKRKLAVEERQNKQNRDDLQAVVGFMRDKGFNPDVEQLRGVKALPDVKGIVTRVDQRNENMEISIGADEGLVAGHELHIYRVSPLPEYLGKAKIISTDPDHANAKVVGKTPMGKRLQEGDIVSSTLPK